MQRGYIYLRGVIYNNFVPSGRDARVREGKVFASRHGPSTAAAAALPVETLGRAQVFFVFSFFLSYTRDALFSRVQGGKLRAAAMIEINSVDRSWAAIVRPLRVHNVGEGSGWESL